MRQAQQLWREPENYTPHAKGEQVWLEGKNLKTSHPTVKLRPKRFGPFEITEVLSKTTYRLNLPPTWKIHNMFHGSLLTPYHEARECGPNYLEPPPELVDGELEYEVADILKSRRHGKGKKLQYLVRWKGYDDSQNTWEPEENIHAPELVRAFHATNSTAIKRLLVKEGMKMKQTTIAYIRHITMDYSTPPLHYPSNMSCDEVDELESPLSSMSRESPCPSAQRPRREEPQSPTFSNYVSYGPHTPLPSVIAYTETPEPPTHPNGGTEVDQSLPDDLNGSHPGTPFFRIADIPGHPQFDIVINGEERQFPFVGYRKYNGNAFQMGTDGFDRPVYAREAQVSPSSFDPHFGINSTEDF